MTTESFEGLAFIVPLEYREGYFEWKSFFDGKFPRISAHVSQGGNFDVTRDPLIVIHDITELSMAAVVSIKDFIKRSGSNDITEQYFAL